MWLQNPHISDHCRKIPASDGCNEIHLLDECSLRLLRYDKDVLRQSRGFGCAACARQSDLWPLVISSDGRIEIAEAIDLGGPKKRHVDAPSLQPVAEELRYRDDDISRFS